MATKTTVDPKLKLVTNNARTTQPAPQAQTMQAQGTQQVQTTQAPQQSTLGSHITNQLTSRNEGRVNVSTPQGIGQDTMKEIRRKAEAGIALDAPNAEKMQAYEQFQQRSAQLIAEAARTGQRLHEPNDWKQSVYDEALKGLNPNDNAYYNSDQIMNRQEQESQERMSAMEEFLTGSRDGYMQSQEALLGKARDEQVAQLQKVLEDAVADGKISVREAEAAFEENKGVIEQQSYQDAQRTKLASSERGISNSMQMLGLQAGDNQRKTSMINKNMTERDRRIADIKDRVNAIKNKLAIDITNANANYNYGIAGAHGQADMQFNTQMFDMYNQDHMLSRQQQFQLDQQGMGENFQLKVAQLQQQFTLEQFAVQQGYNIQNMDITQRYQLQQMYEGHINNMAMQSSAQNWQSGERKETQNWQTSEREGAQDWQSGERKETQSWQSDERIGAQDWQSSERKESQEWQSDEREGAQDWQSGENKLIREATESNLKSQLEANKKDAEEMIKAEEAQYTAALNRELAKYTPNTPEYDLAKFQGEAAIEAMMTELKTKTQLEIAAQGTVDGGPPTNPGPKPKLEDMMSGYEKVRLGFAGTWLGKLGISESSLKKKYEKKYANEVKLWEKSKVAYDNWNKFFD